MCGIIGIVGRTSVAASLYDALTVLQHRGQDAAGITTFTDRFHVRKGVGLVIEVFSESDMRQLRGNLGVGHVRYPTVGAGGVDDAQPFHHTYPVGVAMAHNGNVTNFVELTETRFRNQGTRLNSSCDLEVILWVFQDALAQRLRTGERLTADHVFLAVKCVFEQVKGAYSVVATVADVGMVAFRDPYGIKPITFGERTDSQGTWYACASESVVLDVNGYEQTRSIGPGEAIFVDQERRVTQRRLTDRPHHPCIFEYVYFARPDSVIDGVLVYDTRRRFGVALAERWMARGLPRPEVVVPIPDSSRDAAMAAAERLDVPYREGLIKNRYIGRTFIMPDQSRRSSSIRRKLNTVPEALRGKDVLLVDDSIVRGTTARRIVQMVRSAGARRVFFAVTSPPLVAPCPYGVDMASKREFVAADRSEDEVASFLGVDCLLYLDLAGMNLAARTGNPALESFCNACFTGVYPTPEVTLERLRHIAAERELHGERTSVS